MFRKNKVKATGEQLVSDFQSIVLSLVTASAAEQAAKDSENMVLERISGSSRGNYLDPSNIIGAEGDLVARASVDAHIKKVQAEQLKSLTGHQLQELIARDKQAFVGRRARITSISKTYKPFDGVWFDKTHGYRSSEFKRRSVEGRIQEIDFEKNLIVLKPKKLPRLVNSSLQSYLVYVIDPESLTSTVDIYLH